RTARGAPTYARWRHTSGVPGTAEAAEDLTPDREVPVAERGAHRERVGGPRAAPQHLVPVAEEDLRVLAVREAREARVTVEVGRGPLPHATEEVEQAVGRGPSGMGAHVVGPEAATRTP